MIKYEIIQNRAKFHNGIRYAIGAGCTLDNFEFEPNIIHSYGSKTEAIAAFFSFSTRIEKVGTGSNCYYIVTEYYLQKNIYESTNSFPECDRIYNFSPIHIKVSEIDSNTTIREFSNFADAEQLMNSLMEQNPEKNYTLELPNEIYY